MESLLLYIAIVIYLIWSIRLGLRFVDGRWSILEKPSAKAVKIVVSIILGMFFGWVLIVLRVGLFITHDLPKFLD